FSSRRRHTRSKRDWSSDVCSSDLDQIGVRVADDAVGERGGPVRQGVARAQRQLAIQHAADRGVLVDDVATGVANVNAAVKDSERSEERRVGKECRARWAR